MTVGGKGQNYMSMGQLLEFNVAFPNEKALAPEAYLKGGSKEMILKVASSFLGFKGFNSKYNDSREVLQLIFGPENNILANEIYNRITALERAGRKVSIINTYSSLVLFEKYFEKGEEPETQTHAEFERNFFKAYLVINSEFTRKQYTSSRSTEELQGEFKIAMYLFCMSYPVSDKSNFDIAQIWLTQLIKSSYLFEYLESKKTTNILLSSFLMFFNCLSWQEYLKSLLPLTVPAIKNDKETHININIPQGKGFEQSCAFIEKLMVHEEDELDQNDFLTLRAKPFYKVSDGSYRIIFPLFAVEKIFKGVYFSLREVNKTLPKNQQIPGLKGIYCHEFSEKTLVYRILEIIYPARYIRFSGEQFMKMGIDGSPDYYIRNGKDILLFESKDFLLRADKKMSFDYDVYDQEFSKTLYYEEMPDGREKAGAVMQLINNIERILTNQASFDNYSNVKEKYIYPILIIHDHQYDAPGFNYLINSWFQDELEVLRNRGLFTYHVKPLVVVNIDSLIYHQIGLSSKIQLHEVIGDYLSHIRINPRIKFKPNENPEQYFMNKLIPFSLFIDRLFKARGFVIQPPIVDIVGPSLFKDEYEKRLSNGM